MANSDSVYHITIGNNHGLECDSKTSILQRDKRKWCSYDTVRKRIPIIQWIQYYTFNTFTQDFLAGFTVGLTAIPQGIAYAEVAGIGLQYGLYSGIMGCFVYLILGSCKDINIGPTAIMALMVQEHTAKFGADIAVMLCFLSGCVILLFGILHLGFVVQFISYPVTAGFTSAAALTIGAAQVRSLLGISVKADTFIESWVKVFTHLDMVRWQDTTLGLFSVAVLLLLRYLRRFGRRESLPDATSSENFWGKFWWAMGLGSNAIVVLFGTILAWQFDLYGLRPFKLTGGVTPGLPPFSLPPFTAHYGNETFTFKEMVEEVQIGLLTIPIIAILESVAVAKSFAKGKSVDATQEMIALGMSNICGSFFRSMPTTGSFTRTAINNASGVQTTLGGVFTGTLVILALSFLTVTFQFIPKATLAAVIITAMIFMFEAHAFQLLWRTKKIDLGLFLATGGCCIFYSLEMGIVVGMGLNALVILYGAARPHITIEYKHLGDKRILLVTPSQSLLFPAAEYLRQCVVKNLEFHLKTDSNRLASDGSPKDLSIIVVIDGRNILYIDSTVAKNLKILVQDLQSRKFGIILWQWSLSAESVCQGLDPSLGQLFVHSTTLKIAVGEFESHVIKQNEGETVIQSESGPTRI